MDKMTGIAIMTFGMMIPIISFAALVYFFGFWIGLGFFAVGYFSIGILTLIGMLVVSINSASSSSSNQAAFALLIAAL